MQRYRTCYHPPGSTRFVRDGHGTTITHLQGAWEGWILCMLKKPLQVLHGFIGTSAERRAEPGLLAHTHRQAGMQSVEPVVPCNSAASYRRLLQQEQSESSQQSKNMSSNDLATPLVWFRIHAFPHLTRDEGKQTFKYRLQLPEASKQPQDPDFRVFSAYDSFCHSQVAGCLFIPGRFIQPVSYNYRWSSRDALQQVEMLRTQKK